MPLHDWTRVDAGTFHDFHQGWTIEIRNALNQALPEGFVAAVQAGGGVESEAFARRKNRIVVRHARGEVVAILEVVSPGNKDREHSANRLVGKVREFLRDGVSVLLLDPFPPGEFDPAGLHAAIRAAWMGETTDAVELPPAVVSYDAGEPLTAYLEPLTVGTPLPEVPQFLEPGVYVSLPLEPTYQAAWANLGSDVRELFGEPAS